LFWIIDGERRPIGLWWMKKMLNSFVKLIFQKILKELFKYYFAHFLILLIASSYFLPKRVQKYETFPNILN